MDAEPWGRAMTARPQAEKRPNRVEFMLALLRTAAARARLCASDIDFIGAALQHGEISPDQAMVMLHEAGASALVPEFPPPPAPVQIKDVA
jgi:hypothetical protein